MKGMNTERRNTMKYEELTRRVIGVAMEVHKHLGNGFQEVVYQRALEHELTLKNVLHARELDMPLFYKGLQVGTRRADFVIENKIIVEIKALTDLEDVHLAQIINYLEAYNYEIGLLINFGTRSLQFKRAYNTKHADYKRGLKYRNT